MSKIAVNETYGGNLLRKAIDYFCHLAVAPEFLPRIEKGDKAFAASEFLPQMRWLKDVERRHLRPDLHRHAARGVHVGVRARQAPGPRGAALGPQLRDQAVRGGHRRGVVRQAQEGHPRLHQQDALRPHHDDPALGGLRDERPDRRPERGQLRLHPLPARAGREHAGGRSRAAGAALVRHVDPARALHRQPRDRLRLRHPPDRGARPRELRRVGDRERAARELLDRDAPAAHGHLLGAEPVLPRLPGGPGEARRQGLPLARHHGARPAA